MIKTFAKAVLAVLLGIAGAAIAQTFPSRPIRILVPYPAGGTTDLMARALQEPLQKTLGQPVLIENKPGASGIIAAREVARAAPDGHTLFFVNSGNLAVTPFVVKDAGYDGVKDFAPVALVSSAPMFVVMNAAVPANDLRGFIDFARKSAQPVEYASAGIGSFGHLSSELFVRLAGIKAVHVPYKGQAPTTNAVVAGEVKFLITTASAAMNGFISAGKLKLLGVGSAEPSPMAPGAPTVAATLPGYEATTWFGFVTAAGTPPDIVAKLNETINRQVDSPDMQKRFQGWGLLAQTATPKRLADMIAADVARWGAVVRENNIRAD